MPTKVHRRLPAWSYSRLRDFRQCPRAAFWKHLEKPVVDGIEIVEQENPAMVRGSGIHKLAEGFTLGTIKKLPGELASFTEEFAEARIAKKKGVEESWAFDRDWQSVDWFAFNVWLRIKVDLWIRKSKKILRIIDVKSGKRRGSYDEQMRIYAVGGFTKFSDVDEVHSELWFTDQGEIDSRSYKRAEFPKLRSIIEKSVEPMFSDTVFAPLPGPACRWCIYAKDKTGVCKFSSNGA